MAAVSGLAEGGLAKTCPRWWQMSNLSGLAAAGGKDTDLDG